VNVPFVVAGCIAVLAAVIHGGAGEFLVVRKLSQETLPPTRFGGPRATMAMIHVTWHVATVAFLSVGVALIVAGAALDGDAASAVGWVAAGAATGFAAVVLGIGGAAQSPRSLLTHPGPVVLTAVAVFAWWGVL
jgi:hypothetical protein